MIVSDQQDFHGTLRQKNSESMRSAVDTNIGQDEAAGDHDTNQEQEHDPFFVDVLRTVRAGYMEAAGYREEDGHKQNHTHLINHAEKNPPSHNVVVKEERHEQSQGADPIRDTFIPERTIKQEPIPEPQHQTRQEQDLAPLAQANSRERSSLATNFGSMFLKRTDEPTPPKRAAEEDASQPPTKRMKTQLAGKPGFQTRPTATGSAQTRPPCGFCLAVGDAAMKKAEPERMGQLAERMIACSSCQLQGMGTKLSNLQYASSASQPETPLYLSLFSEDARMALQQAMMDAESEATANYNMVAVLKAQVEEHAVELAEVKATAKRLRGYGLEFAEDRTGHTELRKRFQDNDDRWTFLVKEISRCKTEMNTEFKSKADSSCDSAKLLREILHGVL